MSYRFVQKTFLPFPIVMQKGMRIVYHLKLMGIPFTWKTHISVWEPPNTQ